MIYNQHDFVANMEGAIKAEDHKRVIDILMAEIGAMLSSNKAALIKAVTDSGKQIPATISDSDLVKTIVSGITANNQTFLTNLCTILIKENQQNLSDAGGIVGGVGNMVSGIGNAIGAGLTAKATEDSAKATVTASSNNLLAAKQGMYEAILNSKAATDTAKYGAEAASKQANSSSQTLITVSIVIGIVAVVGSLVFVMYRQNQTNNATGGGVAK